MSNFHQFLECLCFVERDDGDTGLESVHYCFSGYQRVLNA
jgi:hypothetical protein